MAIEPIAVKIHDNSETAPELGHVGGQHDDARPHHVDRYQGGEPHQAHFLA